MKICSLNNTYKNGFSANNVINYNLAPNISEFIKSSTQSKIEATKQKRTAILTDAVFTDFKNYLYSQKIHKYDTLANQMAMLNKIAHSYESQKEIDRAAIILASAIEQSNPKNPYKPNDDDLELLNKFFYSSNNLAAKTYVITTMQKNGSKEFLPIVQNILECDENLATINNKQINYQARLLLNKHYDLNRLQDFFKMGDIYKIAALNLISKWGLEKHVDFVSPLIKDENFKVSDKAQSVERKLKTLQTQSFVKSNNMPNRTIPHGKIFNLASIGKSIDYLPQTLSDEQIKLLGQFGNNIRHIDMLKIIIQKNNAQSLLAVQAYEQIYLRGKICI